MKMCHLFFFLTAAFITTAALAADSKAPVVDPALIYTWHDERGEHQLKLKPDMVAEFGTATASSVKQSHRDAQRTKASRGNAQIWKLSGESGDQVMQKSRALQPASKLSPVFEEGGQLRALPGNIIVRFKPDWTSDMINSWLAARQLRAAGKLDIGRNIFVLYSEPGLAALELANQIHQSGDVISAQPDWWLELGTR